MTEKTHISEIIVLMLVKTFVSKGEYLAFG